MMNQLKPVMTVYCTLSKNVVHSCRRVFNTHDGENPCNAFLAKTLVRDWG